MKVLWIVLAGAALDLRTNPGPPPSDHLGGNSAKDHENQ